MGTNRERRERTILRIRCKRELFREFKRITVDYDNYEEALEMLIEAYKRYLKIYPEFPKLKGKRMGEYVVTGE